MKEIYKNSQIVPNVTVSDDVSATNVYANNIFTLTPLVCSAGMALSWEGLSSGDPETDATWVKMFDDSTATYAQMLNTGYQATNTEVGTMYGGLMYDLGRIYNGRVFIEVSLEQAGPASAGVALFVIGEDDSGGVNDLPWKFTGVSTISPTHLGVWDFFHLSTYFSGRRIMIGGTSGPAYLRFHRVKLWTTDNLDL